MTQTYKAKFKQPNAWFWRSTGPIIGHIYDQTQDKMVCFRKDGGIQEIKHWSQCEIILDKDWVEFTKAELNKAAKQTVPVVPTNEGAK